jgi:hypothetical protein
MQLLPPEQYAFSDQTVEKAEPGRAILRTKFPRGRYRRIAVGDVVVTRRPPGSREK